jgi:hypothetical protein
MRVTRRGQKIMIIVLAIASWALLAQAYLRGLRPPDVVGTVLAICGLAVMTFGALSVVVDLWKDRHGPGQ